ncbi:uncharacterized protein LTR77_009131 [Saxophila tyrrhenica]|uniref:DUF7053 domain-containing protein n=1 Tax=Saxophila tyrrhenica TaxID=1690608 RepID=A0AAV9P3T2_9PEZI|nr:hypothetical protein LTR77_009131 [Saxophila tyrrhenica]
MGKHIVYTKITPLPSNVPRQLALDLLHSHEEVIRMNPLVTEVKIVEAPRTAASDEFFSNWYEITEIITWGFGLKKKIKFHGVFHDQPYGMQSHVYAPMNTDMRQTYKIGGNQPGEPREAKELGVDTPENGLYLREDVNIKVNTPLVGGMVEKEMKSASKVMIDRITRKAELLDEGKLHAMFEQGRLKTSKPSGDPTYVDRPLPSPGSPPGSPLPVGTPETGFQSEFKSPNVDSKGFGRYHDVAPDRNGSVRASQYAPAYQQTGYQGPDYSRPGAQLPGQYPQQSFVSELPGSFYQPQTVDNLRPAPLRPGSQPQSQHVFRAEMMGDTNFLHPQQANQTYDAKPPSPGQIHPAYQQQQHQQQQQQQSPQPSPRLSYQQSPQPSPRLPSQQNIPSRHSSNSSYQVTNPDPPPTNRQSSNVEQWQRSVQSDQPIDGNYYRNSRNSHSGQPMEPDHQRFSNLSIQHNANDAPPVSRSAKCPVCGLFEGDEKAVSHHVSKEHFH